MEITVKLKTTMKKVDNFNLFDLDILKQQWKKLDNFNLFDLDIIDS